MTKIDIVSNYLNQNKGDFDSNFTTRELRDELFEIIESEDNIGQKQQDLLFFVKDKLKELEDSTEEISLSSKVKELFGAGDISYRTTADRVKEQQHLTEIKNIITGKSIHGKLDFDRE